MSCQEIQIIYNKLENATALGSRIPPHAVLLHVNNTPVKLKIIGERSEPHTYRTVGKNLRHIYIYVFYIYIYIYIRPYVVHVPLTRALRANVGPAG